MIREQELIIVDGINGVVIIDPDEVILAEYRVRQGDWLIKQNELQDIRTNLAITRDGTAVELFANIELPEDCGLALENSAMGIGLFRSEFLFLKEDELPNENEQFEAYKAVVESMNGKSVIIRTVDLGKDKIPSWQSESEAPNPALGLTGIRLCMAEPQMFRTQLRALLRASGFGTLKLLLPMLSTISEVKQTRAHLTEVMADLRANNIVFDENIELGGMIEVPAAAMAVGTFLNHLDFVSIGTNDLIQYSLAVDRNDDAVSHLYDPLNPGVLQLLLHVISTSNRIGKPVSMCGEMAGDPSLSRLLLGLGLRRFSMLPIQLLKVKQMILSAEMDLILPIVAQMLAAEDSERLRDLLQELNK